jgi:hypothetical protein
MFANRTAPSWRTVRVSKTTVTPPIGLTRVNGKILGSGASASLAARSVTLPQRSERRSCLFRQQLRLLPRGDVSAFGELIEMNELGIRPLRPASRGRVDLVWKDADCSGDGHVFRGK